MYLPYKITPKLHNDFYLRIFYISVSILRHKTKKIPTWNLQTCNFTWH